MSDNSFRKSEVRFAVVMYGGVSLAIYMNGIAQELLRMVRATATKGDLNDPLFRYEELDPVEAVYRKLAYWQPGCSGIDLIKVKNNAPLPRTFTIDIISGTSAGGINGIFLAKALANGQNMDELKNLWITEGDVNLLLNDGRSVQNTGLKKHKVPESLFNSRRMYQKLLKAFQGMDNDAKENPDKRTPYVDEIDLFVTATDIRGLVLPIKLSDKAVYERKHRTVFHFGLATPKNEEQSKNEKPWNDFNEKFNPMLAFAARCTSSFPFAFEAMRLCDIDEVLKSLKIDRKCYSGNADWKRFFRNYPDSAEEGTIPYTDRPFGDGGYLDNKPFSYAIETIAAKHANYPVDRKLLYIEPVPLHPEDETEKDGKPNALENSMAAMVTLPRYETIREDIDKILERNRLNERIQRIISNIERDKTASSWKPAYELTERYLKWQKNPSGEKEPLWAKPNLNDEEWGRLDLADVTSRKGPGYVAYQRLEIAAVTDDFGRLLARVAGFDENSASALAFRDLVKAWRELRFVEYHATGQKDQQRSNPFNNSEKTGKRTLNGFLHAFDLTFPMRRLNFLHRQIDRIYIMDDKALSSEIRNLLSNGSSTSDIEANSLQYDDKWLSQFREALLANKKQLNDWLVKLRNAGRELRSRFEPDTTIEAGKSDAESSKKKFQVPSPLYEDVERLLKQLSAITEIQKIGKGKSIDGPGKAKSGMPESAYDDVIDYLLDKHYAPPTDGDEAGQRGESIGEKKARRILEKYPEVSALLDTIGDIVQERLQKAIEESDTSCRTLLSPEGDIAAGSIPQQTATGILWSYYRRYSNYDMVIFPMLYGTDGGEGDDIDVIRISPEDAVSLIDERKTGLHKLGGTSLGNFGAFMEKRWRQNDIMWGQLDGAERLITTLIPEKELAKEFISEAHAAIIYETIAPMGIEEGYDLLVEPFMRTGNRAPDAVKLTEFLATLKHYGGKINITGGTRQFVVKPIDEQKIRDHYLEKFHCNKGLEPESALRNAARATTITGKLLTGISEQYNLSGRNYLSLMTNAGRFMLWLVEAAVPRSMPNLIALHWLKLLYLFEVILLASGYIFVNAPVQHFAITAFLVTVVAHSILNWFKSLICYQNYWPNLVKTLAIVLVTLLIIAGGVFIYALLGFNDSWWWQIHGLHFWLKAHLHFG